MMNDKEFMKNNCNRCVNKSNENDLCNIVEKINGTYGCPNEDCININDYIRNEDGDIGIVKKILLPDEKMESTYFVCDTTMASAYLEEIKKHSKDVLDLIEPGDVLEIEEDGDIFYIGIKKESITFSYSDIKESIRNKEVKLLRILTHEQFEENSFKLEG